MVLLQEIVQPYMRFMHKRLSDTYTFIKGTPAQIPHYKLCTFTESLCPNAHRWRGGLLYYDAAEEVTNYSAK